MATEGQFPKVDGDILYASEVNGFLGSILFRTIGSSIITGGASFTLPIGSIIINNPTILRRYDIAIGFQGIGGNSNYTPIISQSGTSFHRYTNNLNGYLISASIDINSPRYITDSILVGSSFGGSLITFYGYKDGNAGSAMIDNVVVIGYNVSGITVSSSIT